jgi:hypothetical protein
MLLILNSPFLTSLGAQRQAIIGHFDKKNGDLFLYKNFIPIFAAQKLRINGKPFSN